MVLLYSLGLFLTQLLFMYLDKVALDAVFNYFLALNYCDSISYRFLINLNPLFSIDTSENDAFVDPVASDPSILRCLIVLTLGSGVS